MRKAKNCVYYKQSFTKFVVYAKLKKIKQKEIFFMKNLLVVFNESIPQDVFEKKNAHLIEVAKKHNVEITFKSNSEIFTFLNTNSVKSFGGNLNYDCCLFFDHDTYLAKSLEMLGMRVINSSMAFLL